MTSPLSVSSLEKLVTADLRDDNPGKALARIQNAVDRVCCDPRCTGRIFGSPLLDALCQKIGAARWRRLPPARPAQTTNGSPPTDVYIASRLYASGGHTAAMADIMRLGPPARKIILLTGITGPTDMAAVARRFDGIADLTFEQPPKSGHLTKLDWLQQRLRAVAPTTAWLFNHHQDSVAVAAVQPDAGYRLRYYHHGDHRLCLGVFLGHGEHIDPHAMGFHNCRDQLGIANNRYLPLVAGDHGTIHASPTPARGLVTCTAASPNKIDPPYTFHYADVVPEVIRLTGGQHIHIGPLSLRTRIRLQRGLRRLGVDRQFIHLPYVNSVWQTLLERQVDLYLASFPYGGGRTLIEAMGAGIATAIHPHHSSRLLCTFDMAPPNALIWNTPAELLEKLRCVNRNTLRKIGEQARTTFLERHHESILAGALARWDYPMLAPPLLPGYAPDPLHQALDLSGRSPWNAWLSPWLCRMVRRWQATRA